MNKIYKPGIINKISLLLFFVFGLFSSAPFPDDVLPDRLIARIKYRDQSQLEELIAHLDVWEIDRQQGVMIALITDINYDTLKNQGVNLTIDQVQTEKINLPQYSKPDQASGIPGFECYRTVDESFASLAAMSQDYQELAEQLDIGDSWEKTVPGGGAGHDLAVLKITNRNITTEKSKFFLLGAIHAREYATAEVALRFSEYLLQNYDQNPDINWLLNTSEIYVLPIANPDGRILAENGEYWRKNTDNDDGCYDANAWGTDLNRNSSFKWGLAGSSDYPCDPTYRGPSQGSEPETIALENFLKGIFPDQRNEDDLSPAPISTTGTFVSLHSYGELILWPWGWSDAQAPNHEQLKTLGEKFGYFTSYNPQQANELYKVSGSTDDWSYGELGIASFTFEIGTEFFQDCDTFEQSIYPNLRSALLYGVKSSRKPYQDPSGPEITSIQVTPTSLSTDELLTINVVADSTRYFNINNPAIIESIECSIDLPPWENGSNTITLKPKDGEFDSSIESAEITISSSGLNAGRHTLYVRGKSSNGSWGVPSAEFIEVIFQFPPDESQKFFLPLISNTLGYQ